MFAAPKRNINSKTNVLSAECSSTMLNVQSTGNEWKTLNTVRIVIGSHNKFGCEKYGSRKKRTVATTGTQFTRQMCNKMNGTTEN